MQFNDLLKGAGFDLAQVAIMLHQPAQAGQRNALLALVVEAPHLFELYQDNHPKNPEATLKKRQFAASFVVNDLGEARFVGLYRINGWSFMTYEEMSQNEFRREVGLRVEGEALSTYSSSETDIGRAVFTLEPLEGLASLKGRLIVPRPPGRAYVRLAENCNLPILRVEETARFIPALPAWDSLVLAATSIRVLPQSWADKMSQWRGIYHILDTTDGARYVGAAYGTDNILGRWQAHVARQTGVTVELAKRDPANFVFSILELLAPTASIEEVVAREGSWKDRLGTRLWGLNKN
jgi:hypothetical protein